MVNMTRRDKGARAIGPRGTPVTSIFDEEALLKVVKRTHVIKMYNWLGTHPETAAVDDLPFTDWSVPREAIKTLKETFVLSTSKVVERHESNRGDTTKLVVELFDGHRVETVVMRHHKRTTVCVSSQVGCQMGCRFCATGTMGIIGDLSSAEILEQYIHAAKVSRIRNVVYMGMGEPLNNYENVKRAVQCMIDTQRFALSPKHVSVSTVGVVKNMYRLTEELPHVNLALSLHAPNQETRLRIVPAAAMHRIERLMEAVDNHIQRNLYGAGNPTQSTSRKPAAAVVAPPTVDDGANADTDDEADAANTSGSNNGNRGSSSSNGGKMRRALEKWTGVMIEYILIDAVNNLETHAHELGALLSANPNRREHIILNLIPYNPTAVAEDYQPPSQESVEKFAAICAAEPYRLKTKVRREMGQDIAGACGQLVVAPQTPRPLRDVEDFSDGAAAAKRPKATVAAAGRRAGKRNEDGAENGDLRWRAAGVAVLSVSALAAGYFFMRRRR
jgi:adenine C2-methylase RlmN of 23S rRNA A2503 and tRNA A37